MKIKFRFLITDERKVTNENGNDSYVISQSWVYKHNVQNVVKHI